MMNSMKDFQKVTIQDKSLNDYTQAIETDDGFIFVEVNNGNSFSVTFQFKEK